jgi:Protein of unknown function (DUF3313)
MIAYKAGSVAFNGGAGYFSGTATSEAYATDSKTNELLWQGADKRAGSVALVQNTTNSWNDVDNAMKDWSQQALTRLQALGACRVDCFAICQVNPKDELRPAINNSCRT